MSGVKGIGESLSEIGGAISGFFKGASGLNDQDRRQLKTKKVLDDPGAAKGGGYDETSWRNANLDPNKGKGTPTLFGRGDQVGWQGDISGIAAKNRAAVNAGSGPLAEGTHIPGLDPQLAGLFGKGNVTGGVPEQYNGMPTMYPAQQSMGTDIFGDTNDLFKRRDALTSQIDSYFAKNPLNGSPRENFGRLAGISRQRSELKALNEQIMNRDNLMAQVFGHITQANSGMAQQKMQSDAFMYGADKDASSRITAAGMGGKEGDPLKSPTELFKALGTIRQGEGFATMDKDTQALIDGLIKSVGGQIQGNFGVAGAAMSTDELK